MTVAVDVLNFGQTGESVVGHMELDDKVFAAPFNESLVHQVVVAHQAAARAGTSAQKSRSDVKARKSKPWRQKGTGRARAGTVSSPLWRSGGVTFASVTRSYAQKVNRKMYRGALRSILSELLRQDRLKVVEKLELPSHKTREYVGVAKRLDLHSVAIVVDQMNDNLVRATGNLYAVRLTSVSGLDLPSLISQDTVLLSQAAVHQLQENLA